MKHKPTEYRKYLKTKSYGEAKQWADLGIISMYEWRAYLMAWEWSAPRFSGRAAEIQDRYFNKCGQKALDYRRGRAQRLFVQFCNKRS